MMENRTLYKWNVELRGGEGRVGAEYRNKTLLKNGMRNTVGCINAYLCVVEFSWLNSGRTSKGMD